MTSITSTTLLIIAISIGSSTTCAAGSGLSIQSSPLELELDGIVRVSQDNGKELLRQATGYQNYDFKIKMPDAARFMIGSNSKLFTTVAIYQLAERGLINLSANVATMLDAADFAKFGLPNQTAFCPRLPPSEACEAITLHQLLSMSSGLYPALNCDAKSAFADECNPDVFIVNPGSIALVVGTFINNPLVFAPGSAYMYSNPNFVLAAFFVQKFSGLTFGAYIHKYILAPIGLADTYFDFFDGQLGGADPLRVYEYFRFFDNTSFTQFAYGPLRRELDTGSVSGTGGLISTPNDLAKFWRTLFNRTTGGSPLLSSRQSQQSILSPWTFISTGLGPNGTIYIYYSQGLIIVCNTKGCPNGPTFLDYEGGTFATHTANVYDYRAGMGGTLAQVWTSSNQYLTTAEALGAARAAGEGPFFPAFAIASQWTAGVPEQSQMAWNLLFRYYGENGPGGAVAAEGGRIELPPLLKRRH